MQIVTNEWIVIVSCISKYSRMLSNITKHTKNFVIQRNQMSVNVKGEHVTIISNVLFYESLTFIFARLVNFNPANLLTVKMLRKRPPINQFHLLEWK